MISQQPRRQLSLSLFFFVFFPDHLGYGKVTGGYYTLFYTTTLGWVEGGLRADQHSLWSFKVSFFY